MMHNVELKDENCEGREKEETLRVREVMKRRTGGNPKRESS